MKKFKKLLHTFVVMFLCTICVFLSACGGGWKLEDIDEDELNNYVLGVGMDNVKVLRRNYGEDRATVIANSLAFYDSYVENLIRYLNSVYGITNYYYDRDLYENIFDEILSIDNENSILQTISTDFADLAKNDYFKYFYDAIRHQIVEAKPYYLAKWKKTGENLYSNADSCPEGYEAFNNYLENPVETSQVPAYYEVIADTSTGWNWGMSYLLEDSEDSSKTANSFIYEYNFNGVVDLTTSNQLKNKFDEADFKYHKDDKGFYGYYSSDAYAGDDIFFVSTAYNNALYIDGNGEGKQTGFEMALTYVVYSILNNQPINNITVAKSSVGNTFAVEGYASVENAMNAQKNLYADKAAYVGLTEEDQKEIVDYILNYVIGEKALEQSKKSTSLQNLYYEEIVTAVVSYCTTLTQTGWSAETGDNTYIGGQYLSSQIVDYEYTTSYVSFDSDTTFGEWGHLGEYEYQSMLLMPDKDCKIDEIWLDFGYTGDGTGESDTIKVRTYIRNYVGNGEFEIYQKDITITENVVQVGEDCTTTIFDFAELSSSGYIKCDKIDFDDTVNSEYYQKRVSGERPLDEYNRVITLGPLAEARNYYALMQGEKRDYGVFNWERLKGTEYENSCYVEVAFEVIESSCDNYKFFCGFSMVTEYEEIDYSQWH